MVKVLPKNDTIRKLIKHPVGGPFRAEGAMDWPDDSFTARRIADGDITVEQAEKKEEPEESVDKNEEPQAIEKKEDPVEQPAAEKVSRSRSK